MPAAAPTCRTIAACSPLDIARAWPVDEPLAALISGSYHPRWAHQSIIARPTEVHQFTMDDGDPLQRTDELLRATRTTPGRWIFNVSYELGRIIEPAVVQSGQSSTHTDRGWPLVQMAWCPDLLIYDHRLEQWRSVGEPFVPEVDADGTGMQVARSAGITSSLSREAYMAAVQRVLEYIAAGDIFQANITQRLTTTAADVNPRHLAADLIRDTQAWYGAAIDVPRTGHLISLSPELFLESGGSSDAERRATVAASSDRTITTRPIKGTRPATEDATRLRNSAKDAAELHMIVDLMRNDLGRVCAPGSVRVEEARAIETHHAVHQGVATIAGDLRPETSLTDVLRATFPAGSITGAPKIRAMQIIEELEPVSRGPYCGSIGWIDPMTGAFALNVAIRTLALTATGDTMTIDYGAGGGIVADSDPAAEYDESMAKATIITGTA